MKLETIIGLEVHIELRTKTKLFCSCPVKSDVSANTNICPICLGHPGVLPVLNEEAIKKTLLLGLALNSEIGEISRFDRKNYFYPDLPKGYQISQFFLPLLKGGFLEIENDGKRKKIDLERIHLEEDAAKLLHGEKGESFVDFNRAGIPLIELVTRPDLTSPEEAKVFLEILHLVVQYLNVSEAEMQKGEMRCDANISLRPKGEKNFSAKTEIKNLNSFKAVEDALNYEIKRQTLLHEEGRPPKTNSTRGFDEKKKITVLQREKEESHDYRYFPEPDLPIFEMKSLPFPLEEIKNSIKELPLAKKDRFIKTYDLLEEEAKILTSDLALADFIEKIISEIKTESEEDRRKFVKLATSWTINRLWPELVKPENFAEFIILISQNKISSASGQKVLEEMKKTGKKPSDIIKENKLEIIGDVEEIKTIAGKIILENKKVVEDFKKGKENALQFLVGQVMKETKGRADPKLVQEILRNFL